MVFCFFLPETNALRPGRPARGRRTCTSVPSIRSLAPSAPAQANRSSSVRSRTPGRRSRGPPAAGGPRGSPPRRWSGPRSTAPLERRVRQPQPQVNQGDQQPVGEHQALLGTRTSRPAPGPAASFAQRRLPGGLPLGAKFSGQLAEMCAGDARQGRVGAGRAGPAGLHSLVNPCSHCPVTVPLPPGVAAGPCSATGTERGRVRPSRSWPAGRPASPDGRSGPEGACRAGRGGGRRTR